MNATKHQDLQGVFFILLAAACIGVQPNIAQYFYDAGGNTFSFLWARTAVAALMGIGLVIVKNGPALKPWKTDWLAPLILGLLLATFFFCHYHALNYMQIPVVTAVVFLYPLVIAAHSILMKSEPPSPWFFATLAVAFLGVLLVAQPQGYAFSLTGFLLALIAAVLITANVILQRRFLRSREVMLASAKSLIVAFGFYLLVAFFTRELTYLSGTLRYIVADGLITALTNISLFLGAQRLSPTRVSLYMNFEIIVAIGLAALLHGQILSPLQYAGCVMILAALVLSKTDVRKLLPRRWSRPSP